MTAQSRIKRWRDAKRQQGLKAVTIWLTVEEEHRLKDLALTYHCAPSELVQQALAQFRPATPLYLSNVTDRELIRDVVREELAALQAASTTVTVGSTAIPPEMLSTETAYEAAPRHGVVTEPQPASPQGSPAALDAQICTWLREHPEGEDVNGLVAALGLPKNKVSLRVNALIKRGQIQMCGTGPAPRYVAQTQHLNHKPQPA
jgi:hypothetical protein